MPFFPPFATTCRETLSKIASGQQKAASRGVDWIQKDQRSIESDKTRKCHLILQRWHFYAVWFGSKNVTGIRIGAKLVGLVIIHLEKSLNTSTPNVMASKKKRGHIKYISPSFVETEWKFWNVEFLMNAWFYYLVLPWKKWGFRHLEMPLFYLDIIKIVNNFKKLICRHIIVYS